MKRRTKRKFKRFFRKNSLVFFVVPLIASIFCFGIAYSQLKKGLDIDGNAKIVGSPQPGDICDIGLTFTETTSFDPNVLQFIVIFTNNSDEDMHSITIRFQKNNKFSFSWGTGVHSSEDDDYIYLELEAWIYAAQLGNNEDGTQRVSLHPGESISIEFGFNITEAMTVDDIRNLGTITNCGQYGDDHYTELKKGNAVLLLSPAEVEIDASIEFVGSNVYSNQLEYIVRLTNNYEFDVTDWRLNIYYGSKYKYDSAWPALFNIIDDKPSGYNINLDSLNTLISANESIEFHFTIIDNDPVYEWDEDGNQFLVVDKDYTPDIVAAGIQEGTAHIIDDDLVEG